MPKNIKLLLTESVEALGIVGDVVNVRTGYARNYLLPRGYATTPSDEAIKAVAARRAQAEKELAEQRRMREELIKKLEGVQITLVRSCNDLGHLYASVTQQEIAASLAEAGYPGVRPRDVRLNTHIKRIDTYDVPIKFEAELEATIKLWVAPDRKLDLEKVEAAEAQAAASPDVASEPTPGAEADAGIDRAPQPEPAARRGKPAADDAPAATVKVKPEPSSKAESRPKPEPKTEGKDKPKPEGKGRGEAKAGKGAAKSDEAEPAAKPDKSGWGKKPEMPSFIPVAPRERRRRRA